MDGKSKGAEMVDRLIKALAALARSTDAGEHAASTLEALSARNRIIALIDDPAGPELLAAAKIGLEFVTHDEYRDARRSPEGDTIRAAIARAESTP